MNKKYNFYAEGGSLDNHGLKEGDQILKTMSGGVQKVKTKTGDIVYVNLANGYRGAEPPLPFAKGGGVRKVGNREYSTGRNWTNDHRHVNKSEQHEVNYNRRNSLFFAGGGEIRRFDRQAQMDSETREEILDVLSESDTPKVLTNYLYGLFDGYDYSETANFKKEVEFLKRKNPKLHQRVVDIYKKIDKYKFEKYKDNYATGGVTKNYVQRKQLNTITIKKGDQKLTYKVSDVYNGAYKLEDGGKLEKLAFYVPKRNVVKVQLRDGKDVKVANGYWIKKGAKPIHTSKYDDGGMIYKDLFEDYENQPAELSEIVSTYMEKFEEDDYDYEDSKKFLAEVEGVGYTFDYGLDNEPYGLRPIGVELNQIEGYEYADGGQLEIKFLKGGKLDSKIQKKVDEVNSLIEKAIDKDGDPIMVVDKSGTWQEPMQYKPIIYKNGRLYFEYYEPYSGKTKKEVVNKSNIEFDGYPMLLDIAKMYRSALKQKGISFGDGGSITDVTSAIFFPNQKNGKIKTSFGDKTKEGLFAMISNVNYYPEEISKAVFEPNEKNGKIKTSFGDKTLIGLTEIIKNVRNTFSDGGKTTFKQKATAIAKNFEGKKVKPKYQKEYGKTYDKAEAKEVGNKIAGSQKAKYDSKMSGGGKTKRGGAMQLAKQIRKDGESWQSALKRANEQVRNK